MDAITPEQVIHHHRTDFKGGKRVTGTVPFFILPVFLSYPLIKEFYRAPFSNRKKNNFRIQRRFDTKKIQNRLELFL